MKSSPIVESSLVTLLGTALLLLSGCQATSGSTGLIHRMEGAQLSEAQLRTLLDDYVRRFIDQVDAATVILLAEETDAEIRRRALLFRMNTSAACAVAASDNDAVAALVDVWALAVQMRHWYESAEAAAMMERHREFAVAICGTLESQIREIATELTNTDSVAEFSAGLESWARGNPVEAPFYGRISTVPHLAREKTEIRKGLLEVVPGLDQRMADLSGRVAFYAALLPRQVRWEAEFLMSVVATPNEYGQAIENVGQMTESLQRVAEQVDELESIIERQRDDILVLVREEADQVMDRVDGMRVDALDRIGEERTEAFADIDRQRKETLEMIREERGVLLASIESQRAAVFEGISEERAVVLRSIEEMRVATLSDARAIAQESIGEGTDRARALMDHALRRGFGYGVGFVAVLFAAGLGFVWLVRKTRS